jgi:hypothetical protein
VWEESSSTRRQLPETGCRLAALILGRTALLVELCDLPHYLLPLSALLPQLVGGQPRVDQCAAVLFDADDALHRGKDH